MPILSLRDEDACRVATIKTLAVTEKKIEDLGTKLAEADREREREKECRSRSSWR